MRLSPLALLLLACSPVQEAPEQLEAFEATNDQATDEYEGSEAAGPTVVSGGDRDWTLVVGGESPATVAVHASGGSDLSTLDGRELSITLGGAWGSNTRSVAISDDTGPLFFGQPDSDYGPATDAFGADFVTFGEEVTKGQLSDDYGTYNVTYRYAEFETDDGAVAALPGEPFEATIDGETWRISVHAAFEVTKYPNMMPGCGGGTDTTLSFEMVLLDGAAVLEPLSPLDGARMSGQNHCG